MDSVKSWEYESVRRSLFHKIIIGFLLMIIGIITSQWGIGIPLAILGYIILIDAGRKLEKP